MAEFTYTVRTANGAIQKGTITAHNKKAAQDSLQQKGFHPLVVREAKGGGLNMNVTLPGSSAVKTKDLVVFTRQFSTMIGAGVPILRALSTLKEQSESPGLRAILDKVTNDVQGGASLSDSLAKHPKVFSDTYVNMVRAGEAGGILDQILNRLAFQQEKDNTIKSKFKGAMIYPAVVSSVAVVAVIFLMVSVIPKLTGILKDAGGELPAQTKLIMGISDLLMQRWPILLGVLALAIFLFRRWTRTKKGRYTFHKLQLRMPIFGKIILKVNVARFARTFSSLLGAGVSVIEALETTAGALSNVVIRQALMDAAGAIKNGQPISDSLAASGILPPIIIQMAAVGE
ncbi:MAG TPA: type II secretion system F family protein, partial [Nitrososphaera sp.]|nr:type II secretion system F family protein [Nitrososphaera sp.]